MKQRQRLLGIALLALATACTNPNGGGDNQSFNGDSPTFNSKIVDWPATKTGFIRVEVNGGKGSFLGNPVPVDANGNFSNVPFPGNAAVTDFLVPYTPPTCATGSITVVPATVKVANGFLKVLNSASNPAGNVDEANTDPQATIPPGTNIVGNKTVGRWFSESAARVSGTCTTNNGTAVWDLNLTAGWNVVVSEITAATGTQGTAYKIYTGGLPSSVKLYVSINANPLSFGK